MRTGLRIIGWILAVLALACLGRDLFVWAQSGRWAPIDVGPLWAAIDPTSLQLAQPAVERHLHPWLWGPMILSVLLAPAFLAIGVLAVLLLALAPRRRHRRSRRFGG